MSTEKQLFGYYCWLLRALLPDYSVITSQRDIVTQHAKLTCPLSIDTRNIFYNKEYSQDIRFEKRVYTCREICLTNLCSAQILMRKPRCYPPERKSFLLLSFRRSRWISEEMPTSSSFKHGNVNIRGGFRVSSPSRSPSDSRFRSWSSRPEQAGFPGTPWRRSIVKN